jgi:hypothetical protein
LRGAILLIELPYSIEYLRPQIEELKQYLPAGSKPILYSDRMIAVGLLDVSVPEQILIRLRKSLDNFSRHWLIGASGTIVCRDGPIDPMESWMRDNFGPSAPRKRPQSQNMGEPQRRTIRLKDAK